MHAYTEHGKEAAIQTLMDNMLTCVYMGTNNSSAETLRAAETLIKGGVTKEGIPFKGIGGKFYYRNVQRLVDVYAEIFSGADPNTLSEAKDSEIRKEIASILNVNKEETSTEHLEQRVSNFKKMFTEVITHEVLSAANEHHSLAYENLQARLRQVLIMLFSNVENKTAIANPNLDEARNSYATWGGDLHGGMIGGNAHKNKQHQLQQMKFLAHQGLYGTTPVTSFYWILENRPSAELQPKSKEGKVTQFDEDQLGRSFEQMNIISHYMLYDRKQERKNTPCEVFEKCKIHSAFTDDSIEALHDRIRLFYNKWAHAQFKIHGAPVSFTYGENVDHQSSLRTPNISAFHRPELIQLIIYCLERMAVRDGVDFVSLTGGLSPQVCYKRALLDKEFGDALDEKIWVKSEGECKMKISALYGYLKEHGLPQSKRYTHRHSFFEEAEAYHLRKERDRIPQENNKGIGFTLSTFFSLIVDGFTLSLKYILETLLFVMKKIKDAFFSESTAPNCCVNAWA